MSKTIVKRVIPVVVLIFLLVGWRIYIHRQYDTPENFAYKPISITGIEKWKRYYNELFGFEIKYPASYYLAHVSDFDESSSFGYISLRQDTSSADEARTVGKRIGVYVYDLKKTSGISVGGYSVKLNREITLDEIEQQFLVEENRPSVLRNCYQRDINGVNTIICIKRAPGEMPMMTSGIYEVFVLGIYEMEHGERYLVQMSNSTGGTPYKRDRSLRYDLLRIFFTLKFKY